MNNKMTATVWSSQDIYNFNGGYFSEKTDYCLR